MLATKGYGRTSGITVQGGLVASMGYGSIVQSFVSRLRRYISSVERNRASSTVEGRP